MALRNEETTKITKYLTLMLWPTFHHYQAGAISTLAHQTINLVVDVVMNKRVTGQPPLRLDSDGLTLEVYKDSPDSIANKSVQTSAGSFSLPDANSLFGERDDIHVEQTVSIKINKKQGVCKQGL